MNKDKQETPEQEDDPRNNPLRPEFYENLRPLVPYFPDDPGPEIPQND